MCSRRSLNAGYASGAELLLDPGGHRGNQEGVHGDSSDESESPEPPESPEGDFRQHVLTSLRNFPASSLTISRASLQESSLDPHSEQQVDWASRNRLSARVTAASRARIRELQLLPALRRVARFRKIEKRLGVLDDVHQCVLAGIRLALALRAAAGVGKLEQLRCLGNGPSQSDERVLVFFYLCFLFLRSDEVQAPVDESIHAFTELSVALRREIPQQHRDRRGENWRPKIHVTVLVPLPEHEAQQEHGNDETGGDSERIDGNFGPASRSLLG